MGIIRDESRPTDDRNEAIGLLAKAKESEKVAEFLLTLLDDKTRSLTRVQEHPADGSNVSSQEGPPPPSPEVTSDDPAFVECLMETLPRLNVRGGAIIPIYLRLGYLDIRMFSNRLESAVLDALFAGIADSSLPARLRAGAIYHTGIVVRDNMASEEPVEALIGASDDPDVAVRIAAVRALGKFGRDSAPAVPRLISLLDDRKTQQFGKTPYAVRAFAAETLGEIGAESHAALPKLRKIAAGVESAVIQKFAKAATEKIESAIASESGRALP